MPRRSKKDNRGDNEVVRGRKRRNRGGRTTNLNPKTKTENSPNAQNAERHRIHAFFSNVQNALRGKKYLTAPARNCTETAQNHAVSV